MCPTNTEGAIYVLKGTAFFGLGDVNSTGLELTSAGLQAQAVGRSRRALQLRLFRRTALAAEEIFPILGWGLGLAIQGYTAYYGGGPSEDEIEREMNNLAR